MILDDIVLSTKNRYKEKLTNLEEIKMKALNLPKKDNLFYKALLDNSFNFILEVKKASPSKGQISKDFNYINMALDYEKSNAKAISVLTEPNFFLGSDEYLVNIKNTVSIPILRKDFTICEYQIYESRILNADAILLIARILSSNELEKFINICNKLGLDYIVEIHDESDLVKAINVNAKIIGINNRNLDDFSVNINNSIKLKEILDKKIINKDVIIISESGIKTVKDILKLKRVGISNYLIGEAVID